MSDVTKNIVEFTLIYNQHKTKLYNYARKMLGDTMMCEDIVQNVFEKFFENMSSIRNSERVDVWLYTTTRNAIYTYYRTKKTRADQFNMLDTDEIEINSSVNLEEELELKELHELIMNELNKLEVEQRDVFLLKEYGNLSYKEISEVMKIDENLVKSRLYKTRQRLIAKLSKVILNER
ncbi:MAG: RNA polymerase sigma factor [Ignavibacteriaceae bacterium]|nr:RNA polymerase sigma factor [Ignavibacteriaceae bacterium]